MADTNDKKDDKKEAAKKTLSLGGKGTLSLKGGSGASDSAASGGRSTVAVEVRRRRTTQETSPSSRQKSSQSDGLTDAERQKRMEVLERARKQDEERLRIQEEMKARNAAENQKAKEEQEAQKSQEAQEETAPTETSDVPEAISLSPTMVPGTRREGLPDRIDLSHHRKPKSRDDSDDSSESDSGSVSYRERMKRAEQKKPRRTTGDNARTGKLTVTQVLNQDYERDRGPSLAAQRRAREKERMRAQGDQEPKKKQVRDVVIPEAITVQDLANRMAERVADVTKALMKLGVIATPTQPIDADTAELVVTEYGHNFKRVTEADVEEGLDSDNDPVESLKPRAPVVTIMGHVDHGKTSLLDALRQSDVVGGEAGGITQHIGAYQIKRKDGQKITFLDTPGHAAFTQMRARGANVTDIVILVVAANDGVMPQTIEALSHAKAAGVPMIVAVNKIDLPEADSTRVKNELLQHEIITEDLGGETMCVEVSAKNKIGLDDLIDSIMLQAEINEYKANPNRSAVGSVIESKMETGKGSVATVLVQKGTLEVGDIFVCGTEFGKVRAMMNERGERLKKATPSQPVEILGFNGTPDAGDGFYVVDSEARAREIAEYRVRRNRDQNAATLSKSRTIDNLFSADPNAAPVKELPIIIKGDVHGSVEALQGSFAKIEEENEGFVIRVLHAAAGGINETDVSLAQSTGALIIGFNVRANAQARDLAEKEKVDIRYYSIIYNAIDDVKNILTGLLDPTIREEFIGNALIKEVFNITKVGKIAGCVVTEGFVKRGAKVRLLRDDVVIHEGTLKTLKRFKDEVKDVKEGTECGMAFERYDDIKEGDIIECFDVISEERKVS